MAPIGTILGSILIGKPSDTFGRKKVLFALALGYFVSALGCGLAESWWQLLCARFIGGLAIGGASVVTPMYIAEISPPRLRGRLVMINQLNIVLGISFLHFELRSSRSASPSTSPGGGCSGVLAFPSIVFFV